MKVTYYISNEQDKIPYSDKFEKIIKENVENTLECENFGKDAEVSVTFVDNARIKELNSEFRNIDRETDVLSFPMDEDGNDSVLGDIVISLEKAKAQSEEYGHSLEREIAFLCVHSVLHLLGYDHERSEDEEKEMFEKQENILVLTGYTR